MLHMCAKHVLGACVCKAHMRVLIKPVVKPIVSHHCTEANFLGKPDNIETLPLTPVK